MTPLSGVGDYSLYPGNRLILCCARCAVGALLEGTVEVHIPLCAGAVLYQQLRRHG